MADKLKITLVKSTIGAVPKHVKTVEALGLKKVNKTVEMPDNADTVQEMVKQQVKAIKDRKLVPELQDQALKVVRCHYTDESRKEDSLAETPKRSFL